MNAHISEVPQKRRRCIIDRYHVRLWAIEEESLALSRSRVVAVATRDCRAARGVHARVDRGYGYVGRTFGPNPTPKIEVTGRPAVVTQLKYML